MCVVSAVLDDFNRRNQPWIDPIKDWPMPQRDHRGGFIRSGPSYEEFEALRKEVEKLKEEVAAARKQDEENGEPECEMDEKKELIKKICELVGVDIKEFCPND